MIPPGTTARHVGRLPVLLLLTLGQWGAWRAGRPLARRLGAEVGWRRRMFSLWGRGALRVMGFRVEREGAPPGEPCLLVANHLGYVDIAVLAAELGCTFVSMDEVVDWPLIGRIARDLGTVFVDRERPRDAPRVAEELAARLRAGETVVLFPEGRAGDGAALRPFRAPLLDPAARERLPVRWVALAYQTEPPDPPAARAVCWADEVPFGAHAWGLIGLRRVRARVAYGEAPLRDDDRKRLAASLRAAVAARLGLT